MKKKEVILAAALSALAVAPSQAADESEKIGRFQFKVITDPMSDATRGIASSAEADSITMVVKCDQNGPGSLYVSFIADNYLGGTRGNRIRALKYRIDDAAPQTIAAYYDGRTANLFDFKPTSAEGRWFAETLGAKKLTVQVTSYDFDAYTQVIDLEGYRLAVSKVAAACKDSHWL